MDPYPVKVPTPQTIQKARADQLEATASAFGVTGGITGLNYVFNAPGPPTLQKLGKVVLTGIDVKPTDTGRASVKIPKVTFLAALLPQPIGYVPAEVYGLAPDTYVRNLGFKVGQKPPFFSASPARLEVYEARQEAQRIGRKAFSVTIPPQPGEQQPERRALPSGTIDITEGEFQFLKAIPQGLLPNPAIVSALEARRGDFRDAPRAAPGSSAPVGAAAPGLPAELGRLLALASGATTPVGAAPTSAAGVDGAGNRDRNQRAAHIELRDP